MEVIKIINKVLKVLNYKIKRITVIDKCKIDSFNLIKDGVGINGIIEKSHYIYKLSKI